MNGKTIKETLERLNIIRTLHKHEIYKFLCMNINLKDILKH